MEYRIPFTAYVGLCFDLLRVVFGADCSPGLLSFAGPRSRSQCQSVRLVKVENQNNKSTWLSDSRPFLGCLGALRSRPKRLS